MQFVDAQTAYPEGYSEARHLPVAAERMPSYGERSSSFFEKGIGRLVTVRELAEILACSEKTIRDWVLKGLIPVVRPMPRMVRFDLQEVRRWLSDRRQ